MTLAGHIQGGQVVLDEPGTLPDGTAVEVIVVAPASSQANRLEAKSIWDDLAELAGSVEGPSDLAAEHDHYVRGTPKRNRP